MDQSTTEKILTGAAEIFAQVGFDAARVDAIADACGVNKASLYYHFKDKKTLYNAVVSHYLRLARVEIEERLPPSDNYFDRLRNHIRAMLTCFHAGRFISPIILREAASGGQNLTRETMEIMRTILGRFRLILEEGVAAGAFEKKDLSFIHMSVIGTGHFLIGGAPLRERFIAEGLLSSDDLPSLDPADNADRIYEMVAAYLKIKETA